MIMEIEKFKELCKEIAKLMDYEFEDNLSIQHNFFKIKQGEYCIYLAENYGSIGTLTVTGEYPRNCKGEYYVPKYDISIKMSLNKSIYEIVKGIKKRFLPKYEENILIIQEQIKFANEYYSKKDRLLHELSEYIGIAPAKHKEYCIHHYRNNGTIQFTVSRETGFDLILNDINLEQAKAIWDIIK